MPIINNIDFRLLITDRQLNTVEQIELMNDVSDFNSDASKLQYKIINGDYDRGIIQGIYAVTAGSKISLSLPLYPKNGEGVQAIIEYWKSYFNNANIFRFFILRTENSRVFSKEVKPADTMKYKSTFYNNAGVSQITFLCIDNFYKGEKITGVVPEFSGVPSGSYAVAYASETKIKTKTEFKISLTNTLESFYSFNFYSVNGVGISYSGNIPPLAVLELKNDNLFLSGTGFAPKAVFYNGNTPYLEIGSTSLGFITNLEVGNFEISYIPRADL